jgi:hypothetical protein
MSTKNGIGFAVGIVIIALLAFKNSAKLADVLQTGIHQADTGTPAMGGQVYDYRKALSNLLKKGGQ